MITVPNGYDEVIAVYGDPKFRDLGDGQLAVDDSWEEQNCITITVPGYDRRLYVHRLVAQPFLMALGNAMARRPDYVVRTLGCFNPRCKRLLQIVDGKRIVTFRPDKPSIHAWAAAIDMNADTNQYGSTSYDMPSEFVEEFAAQGFVWGGQFHTPDPMHFQLARGV